LTKEKISYIQCLNLRKLKGGERDRPREYREETSSSSEGGEGACSLGRPKNLREDSNRTRKKFSNQNRVEKIRKRKRERVAIFRGGAIKEEKKKAA